MQYVIVPDPDGTFLQSGSPVSIQQFPDGVVVGSKYAVISSAITDPLLFAGSQDLVATSPDQIVTAAADATAAILPAGVTVADPTNSEATITFPANSDGMSADIGLAQLQQMVSTLLDNSLASVSTLMSVAAIAPFDVNGMAHDMTVQQFQLMMLAYGKGVITNRARLLALAAASSLAAVSAI